MSVAQVFKRKIDLDGTTPIETGKNDMYEGDAKAQAFELTIQRAGKDVTLTGYTAVGEFLRADGGTVSCPGTVAGSVVTVTLPEACYKQPGDFTLDIKLSKSGETRTVMRATGTVRKSGSGVVVDVDETLVNIAGIIQLYGRMEQAAAATETATTRANDAADAATGAASAANTAAERAERAAQGYEQGNVANADMLAGKGPGFYETTENLLDNYFWESKPVNQQEASEYSGAGRLYDRWTGMSRIKAAWKESDGGLLSFTGMRLTNTAPTVGVAYMQQVIPEERLLQALSASAESEKKLTVVLVTPAGIFAATGAAGTGIEVANSTSGTNVTVKATLLQSGGKNIFRLTIPQGVEGEQIISWVGLFPGSFSAYDVPRLQTRSQGEELARCQWFYRRHRAAATYGTLGMGMARTATTAWVMIARRRMRSDTPTVTVGGTLQLQHGNGSSIPATAVTVDKVSDDWIRLTVTVASGLSVGMPLVAHSGADSNVYIDEDCDVI